MVDEFEGVQKDHHRFRDRAYSWRAIQAMNYHEYSCFMLFALCRVVETEFSLIVQDDGWVLSIDNWHDDFLHYDYLGAPIHLAHVEAPDGVRWVRQFDWCKDMGRPGFTVTPVLNGGSACAVSA